MKKLLAALILAVTLCSSTLALAMGETEIVLPATSEHFFIDVQEDYKVIQTGAGPAIQVGTDLFMFGEVKTEMSAVEYVNHYYDDLFDEYIVSLLTGTSFAEGRVNLGIPARYQINKTPDGLLLGFALFPGEEYVLLIICTAPGDSKTLQPRLIKILEEMWPKY